MIYGTFIQQKSCWRMKRHASTISRRTGGRWRQVGEQRVQSGVFGSMSTKSKSPTVPPQRRASIKSARSDRPAAPKERLWRQMSELISLRERVAQAELATPKLDIENEGASNRPHRPMKGRARKTTASGFPCEIDPTLFRSAHLAADPPRNK